MKGRRSGAFWRVKGIPASRVSGLPALNKLVFPQTGKKFLPGDGQDVVGESTYWILANKDDIFKYTFFFQIF